MEIPDKTSEDGIPRRSMESEFEDGNFVSKSACVYGGLLESVFMIPFRRLGFQSSAPVFPVLLDQIKVNVDSQSSSATKYTVNLSYGRQKWKINVGIVQLFSLNAYLHYRGVTDLRRDKPNICGEGQFRGVEEFLRTVLHRSRILDIGKVYDFFRISRYSFNGTKMFEDKFHVSIMDLNESRCRTSCYGVLEISGKIYVVSKRSHLVFVDYRNGYRDMNVLFYRRDLDVKYKADVFYSKITMVRDGRKYVIKSFRHDSVLQLFNEIQKGLEERRGSERLFSFSPVRRGSMINFYVDGKSYFWNLYETLHLARREVFIAGWWIYPTLYLRREYVGGKLDEKYRIDYVLKELAEEGIRIRILVYGEVFGALKMNSNHTCEFLSNLHKRIEVLRHPDSIGHAPIYWTHHEKLVVIDQRIAYVGGIDLAPGRYDTQEHSLFRTEWACGGLGTDRRKEEVFSKILELPWHDVQCKVVGGSAFDISQHFIERWNFVISKYDGEGGSARLLIPNEEFIEIEQTLGDLEVNRAFPKTQVLRSVGKWSLGYDEDSISRGYSEVIRNSKRFIYMENQFFITKCDLAPGYPENTIGRALVERIIQADRAKEEFKVYVVIPLCPIFDGGFMVGLTPAAEIVRIQSESISRGDTCLHQVLKRNGVDSGRYIVFMCLRKIHFDGKRIGQEQIYVHSKMIIADGTSAIVGSANLNDRSMLGNRDTEVALLVRDEREVVCKLLKRLLKEHLGAWEEDQNRYGPKDFLESWLLGNELDLASDDVFTRIVARARGNTEMFEKMFGNIKSYAGGHLNLYSVESDFIWEVLNGIKGHLVLFTDNFPVDREVGRSIFGIQALIPSVIYY
ncbi:phospholipase D [Encephalitozoon intestinalis ATCC 50506]|uniref:Phospholipase n=1 Tax=Encephalitozoon intestinalis (strain ATCC 50506) TaxID=876142 RepID=E0S9Y4_ENCIT|nr:phospholipase D [Encephalitozoon intestinalis ATCC 50506]ADM12606.1 phospholipase D [Encephalitozoon intestinalis ATCC 50506]UTX46464.1 phospholipase D alpha [Encephalitozoon intestinalis]